MTVFAFDAKTALQRARKQPALPNRPNPPNRSVSAVPELGGLGRLGALHVTCPEKPPDEIVCDDNKELAVNRGFSGGQNAETTDRDTRIDAIRESEVIWLRDWRDNADDTANPDVWR